MILAYVKALGPVRTVRIERAVSHGREGSVSGSWDRGAGEVSFALFLAFYNTKGTHVKSIEGYTAGA